MPDTQKPCDDQGLLFQATTFAVFIAQQQKILRARICNHDGPLGDAKFHWSSLTLHLKLSKEPV
jgi:hypothetical protein